MRLGHANHLQLPGRSSIAYSLGFSFQSFTNTQIRDEGKKPPHLELHEMVINFRENEVVVHTVGEGIFMGFFFLAQTYCLSLLCSCHYDKRSDLVLLHQPCKVACMEQIYTQHVNVPVLGECRTLQNRTGKQHLRQILRTHASHAFLQGTALHLCWPPVWMLLVVAMFRGYCLCLLEDLFFWQGKEFSGHNHNPSLNILRFFK